MRSIGGKNSFSVVEIDQQNIRNFSNIGKKKLLFRKVSDDGNPVRWKDIRWLKYNGAFAKILFKYSLTEDEPFKELNIQKRGVTEISIDSVEKCYKDLLPISVEKKRSNRFITIDRPTIPRFLQISENKHCFRLSSGSYRNG